VVIETTYRDDRSLDKDFPQEGPSWPEITHTRDGDASCTSIRRRGESGRAARAGGKESQASPSPSRLHEAAHRRVRQQVEERRLAEDPRRTPCGKMRSREVEGRAVSGGAVGARSSRAMGGRNAQDKRTSRPARAQVWR